MTAPLSVLTLSGVALLALVIGYALCWAATRRQIRKAKADVLEAQADALRFVHAKHVISSGIRSRAEQAAGMVP
jgi:hypothetical protein